MVSTSHTTARGITKHSEGTISPEANVEETILETDGLGEISGWVSLRNMKEGDEVTIKSYAKLEPGAPFERHESSSYRDAQEESSLRFLDFVGCYGIKITLTQTAGTPRAYPYMFARKG